MFSRYGFALRDVGVRRSDGKEGHDLCRKMQVLKDWRLQSGLLRLEFLVDVWTGVYSYEKAHTMK
jgi:hypothetical protein